MTKHNYNVEITINVIVTNAKTPQEAKEKAILMLDDDFKEYLSEAEVIRVTNIGETREKK